MPVNNLSQLVRAIRSGEVKLDKETADKAMELVARDHKVGRSEELDLLRDLAESAPEATDYGRALLRNFVEDARARFSDVDTHLSRARELLADEAGARLPQRAEYVKAAGLTESAQKGAREDLVGQDALFALVKHYRLAYRGSLAPSSSGGVDRKVMDFYNDYVTNQPIPEDDPLGPVRAFLEDNYKEPPAPDPAPHRSSSGGGGIWGAWLRLWGW